MSTVGLLVKILSITIEVLEASGGINKVCKEQV